MTKRKNPYQPITLEQAIETMTKVRDFYRDNPTRWSKGHLVALYDAVNRQCLKIAKTKFNGSDDECYCIIGACHVFTSNRPALPKKYNPTTSTYLTQDELETEIITLMYQNPVLDYLFPFFRDVDKLPRASGTDENGETYTGQVYRSVIYDFNDDEETTYEDFMYKLDEIVDGLTNGVVTAPVDEYHEEVTDIV